MKRAAAALLGAGLLLGAADAAGEPAAPSPPQRVTSKDGGLTVSVPRGALPKPVKVRIRVLTPSQYPPELKGATFKPGSKLYALEPAGLRFLKPVTITRRIDAKLQGFDLAQGVPGVVLTTRDARGKWEILKGQSVKLAGKTLVVGAKASHFSTVVAFDGGGRVSLDPPSVERFVGETFDVKLKLDVDNAHRANTIEVSEDDSAFVDLVGGDLGGEVHRVREWDPCADLHLRESRNRGVLADRHVGGKRARFARRHVREPRIPADVQPERHRCLQGQAVRLRRELALACVLVTHSVFGSFPSFTNWVLQFTRVDAAPERAGRADRRRRQQRPARLRRRRPGDRKGRHQGRHQLVRAEAGAEADGQRPGRDAAARREGRRGADGDVEPGRDRGPVPRLARA